MTRTNQPLAIVLAAVMFAALWVPTLIMPQPAQAAVIMQPAALA